MLPDHAPHPNTPGFPRHNTPPLAKTQPHRRTQSHVCSTALQTPTHSARPLSPARPASGGVQDPTHQLQLCYLLHMVTIGTCAGQAIKQLASAHPRLYQALLRLERNADGRVSDHMLAKVLQH